MSFSRISALALALAAGLAAPASAATYNIAFTQNGLGDGGPDWFGTFQAGSGPGLLGVTQFNVTIGVVTYDDLTLGLAFFDGSSITDGLPVLSGLVVDEVVEPNLFGLGIPDFSKIQNILVLSGLPEGSGPVRTWGFGSACSVESCTTREVLGTYTITRAADPEPPVIPLPATAALLPLGLGALAALRRRKAG